MCKKKPPQDWYIGNGCAFITIDRRNGDKVRVKASAEDVPKLRRYRWVMDGKGRAFTAQSGQPYMAMHRMVMLPPDGLVIDHINNDYLDNRRENLRICTHAQNLRNQLPSNGAQVHYKGVTKDNDNRKKPYRAKIAHNSKLINIGSFYTPKEAAMAYDKEAKRLHGKYAKTNEELGLL